MPRRLTGALMVFALLSAWTVRAQEAPVAPAVLELLLPAGATATADGVALGDKRSVTVTDLKPAETRRVKVAVRFADGVADERLVDVTAGQRIPVAVPHPGPDKPVTVAVQPLSPINAAAVSRDGRFIAVALEDRAVVLWDTAVGKPVRTLAGHQKPVLSVAFSPDSKHILSGSADATAILWDVNTGSPVRTFKGHTGSVVSVAFGPDGDRCFTGSPDGTAILWATKTAERVHTIRSRGIQGVAYSPDGTTLGTASTDFTATLWDAKTGNLAVVLRGHREDVNCIAFSPDGRRVITGSSEDIGVIWDVTTGKRITPTGRHTNNIHSVAFTPDGRRVITGEREELVMMWDAATGASARTFAGHTAEIFSILPSPDGRTMLTASRDGTARLWDLATGRELLTLTTDAARKTWAVVAPDGLIDGSESGRRVLGFRFTKLPGADAEQFFIHGYRPGLLAEVWRGDRPVASLPLGRSKPPLVKVVGPKKLSAAAPTATVSVDVTDQGGGVTDLVVENNGVRLAVGTKSEPAPGGKATRSTFTVTLTPGVNKVRVRASSADGSWESTPADVEVTHPRTPGQRGRLYVVAVGVGSYAEKGLNLSHPAKDVAALGELFQTRGANLHDRVDVVPVFDHAATKATIVDTIQDVAELTRPQDTLAVVLCGHGALLGERLYVAPHDLRFENDSPEDALRKRGIAVDELAAAMGTAPALRRVLVVDATTRAGGPKERSEVALRGAVERWARAYGVHTLAAATGTGRGSLAHALLTAADKFEAEKVIDVADWFPTATDLAGSPRHVQASSQSRGVPIFVPVK